MGKCLDKNTRTSLRDADKIKKKKNETSLTFNKCFLLSLSGNTGTNWPSGNQIIIIHCSTLTYLQTLRRNTLTIAKAITKGLRVMLANLKEKFSRTDFFFMSRCI